MGLTNTRTYLEIKEGLCGPRLVKPTVNTWKTDAKTNGAQNTRSPKNATRRSNCGIVRSTFPTLDCRVLAVSQPIQLVLQQYIVRYISTFCLTNKQTYPYFETPTMPEPPQLDTGSLVSSKGSHLDFLCDLWRGSNTKPHPPPRPVDQEPAVLRPSRYPRVGVHCLAVVVRPACWQKRARQGSEGSTVFRGLNTNACRIGDNSIFF